jgi:Protein of unknown function (DUF4435)
VDVDDRDSWRWTLDEYLLRCELGDGLREVLVEGGLDRELFQDALTRWDIKDVGVLDASYFLLSPEDIADAGHSVGAKGLLLTIASSLAAMKQQAVIRAETIIIVDRDYDELGAWPDNSVLVTDGHSIENYAFSPEALDRFVRLGLGRGARPRGGGTGTQTPRRRTCTGEDLYSRLAPAAAEIAAVRLVLRSLSPPLSIFEKWSDYVHVASDGRLVTRADDLLKNVLDRASQPQDLDVAEEELSYAMTRTLADAFRMTRGHDFVCLLGKLLRSSWGRPIAGIFSRASETTLSRAVLSFLDPGRLDSHPLFVELRARLA